jgi:septum site-determining protein MinC
MVSDPSSPPLVTESSMPLPDPGDRGQIQLTSANGYVQLVLPNTAPGDHAAADPALPWGEWLQQIKLRLNANQRFWQAHTAVHLTTHDRLLDVRQLQALADLLANHDLDLQRIATSRRQTALAAATLGYSVDQGPPVTRLVQAPWAPGRSLENPIYLETTVRSGVEIRHGGTIVVLGDTNPGSALLAAGDILVWGRLRGMAHAGMDGNRNCRIMALQMMPTQLRIADLVARPPETPPAEYLPEVAYVGAEAIRIAMAQDFAHQHLQHSGGVEVP